MKTLGEDLRESADKTEAETRANRARGALRQLGFAVLTFVLFSLGKACRRWFVFGDFTGEIPPILYTYPA